ncbi:MAG: Ppx/GppA phosphatase family protein [Hyphomicrobiaceae bacterium]
MEGLQDDEGVPGTSEPPKLEPVNAQPPPDVAADARLSENGQLRNPTSDVRSDADAACVAQVARGPSARRPDPSRDDLDGWHSRSSTHGGGVRGPLQTSEREVYGALDLGTNNCRLLLARPSRRGFQVIDAFSRIIRLGEGVSQTGLLSEAAMRRTIDALRVCAQKIERHGVRRAMLVATEACRVAANGQEFLERVELSTGLKIEILSREGEARLAVSGCASLIDPGVDYVLVFDIGGGSSELVWLDLTRISREARGGLLNRAALESAMMAWTSLPVGVVTLAETFGGRFVNEDVFEAMVNHVIQMLAPFEAQHGFSRRMGGGSRHLLGTSGTVTTVAGVYLGLPRYDRNRVDGCWLDAQAARDVVYELLGRSYSERIAEPCIGRDRADLVLAGCAILEALMRMWPSPRLRVADRGLREGILMKLMGEDRSIRSGRRRRRRRGRGKRI